MYQNQKLFLIWITATVEHRTMFYSSILEVIIEVIIIALQCLFRLDTF